MLDSGHSRADVLNYEVPYLHAFMIKKLDIIDQAKRKPEKETSYTRSGRKRTVKRMTSAQMIAKLRAKRR